MRGWIVLCTKAFVATVALIAFSVIPVSAETYRIDAAHSRIAFSVRHFIGTARGEFHKFEGTIEVDPREPERSSVNVKIQVASIDTGIEKRDEHLRSAEFFDAERFPEIIFRSRKVERTGLDGGEIVGDLTIHGVTHSISLRVKLATPLQGNTAPARVRWLVETEPLRRKDFGLLFGGAAEAMSGIAREVVVTIEIEATKKP